MGRTLKMKVSATNSALNLLSELQEKYGKKLMFHQSGGCCDGSAPMCFQEGGEKRWNNTQEVTEREDGGVDFEITVCDLVEIKAWVLSWGLHARATGPKRLLDEIKAELKEMKKQYA